MHNSSNSLKDFRWVVTESDFRKALRRGYAGDVLPYIDSQATRFDPIRLDSPATVSSTAAQVRNPDLQLGEPVSVTWDTHFLDRLQKSQIVETLGGFIEIHALLPLIHPLFSVRFASPLRAEMFTLEMSNNLDLNLLTQLHPVEIDPALTDPRGQHGRKAPTYSPTLPISGPSINSPTAYFELQTFDRLSGAAELLSASDSGASQIDLLCTAMSPVPSSTASDLSSDLHAARWGTPNSSSLLAAVCTFILQFPPRLTLRPLTIEEKSDLVLHVLSTGSNDQDQKLFLDELLHLVRTGEGLNHLLTKTSNLVLQSLVIFMSNNRDPREVADLKASNFGIDRAALALCAFFTGLRYPREVIPRDLVWPPLRTADVQDFVSLANGQSEGLDPGRRLIEVDDEILRFNGEVFSRPTQADVLELSKTFSRVRIRPQKRLYAHSGVGRILLRDRSQIARCKMIEVPQVRSGDEVKFAREIDLQQSKATSTRLASWKLGIFNNRNIDQLVESKRYIELKIDGTIWIELNDGTRLEYQSVSIELPLECVPLGNLRESSKPSATKLKRLLVSSFVSRTIRF